MLAEGLLSPHEEQSSGSIGLEALEGQDQSREKRPHENDGSEEVGGVEGSEKDLENHLTSSYRKHYY